MRAASLIRSLWWNLRHRRRVEAALDEELAAYVDLLEADYEARGYTSDDARRAALIETGGVTQVKEATRGAWMGESLAAFARDVRVALRSLGRAPAFVAIAVTTLAIGIAGATAVFTTIDAALLKPLPMAAHPEQLVGFERTMPTTTLDDFSYPDYRDLNDQTTAFSGIAAFNGTSMLFGSSPDAPRVWVSYVSANFFDVLAVRPLLGRFFVASDLNGETSSPVVLGYDAWRGQFHADSGVVGSTVVLNQTRFTIIGVAPRGFVGAMMLHPMDFFITVRDAQRATHAVMNDGDPLRARNNGWLWLIGRLRPGVSIERAQRDVSTVMLRLAATYPSNRGRGAHLFRGAGMTVEERAATARIPVLLGAATALLLLLACGNVAGLSLVRAAAKRRELATRVALGASRASLVRSMFIEGALIATAAAVAGFLLTQALVHTSTVIASIASVHVFALALDLPILFVTVAVTALTAILVSLLPAIEALRTDVHTLLKNGAGGAIRRRSPAQRALVMLQVAASLVLLASAAVIRGAFQRVTRTDPGFDAHGVAVDNIDSRTVGYDSTRRLLLFQQLLTRGGGDPAFDGVALSSTLPPQEYETRVSIFHPGEEPPQDALDGHEFELGLRVAVDAVSPNLFGVMRIPILLGRGFTAGDGAEATPVVIVSRRLAHEFWPDRDAVGQYISWPSLGGAKRPPMRVVGVAADTRHKSLTADPSLLMYVPYAQHPEFDPFLFIRGRNDTPPGPRAVHEFIRSVDRVVIDRGATRVDEWVYRVTRGQRIASVWVAAFGVIALLLAAIGLYGVIAQAVQQRTRELAVRTALGASPAAVLTLILRDGLRLSLAGGLIGVCGAAAAWRSLRSIVAGVDPADAYTMLAAVAVLAVAMFAATYLPARRAARLNPVDALRSD